MSGRAERLLQSLSPQEKADLLIAMASDDTGQYDESEQFEIDLISEYADEIQQTIDTWGKHQGLDFGYKAINNMTLGMTPGEVLLLSGDSNHGKTQFALNLAYQQAKRGDMVFFITLEMTQGQIGARLVKIALQDGLSMTDALSLPIIVQRTKRLNYHNVPGLVRQAKEAGASIVFLDHVHSFARSSEAHKTTEVAAISMEIKRAALESRLPIVALCQCRKLEDSSGNPRKPNKNDLKDAAELYQDCDMCLMVWRDKFSDGGAHANEVEVRIWKNRLREMRGKYMIAKFTSLEGARLIELPGEVYQAN